MTSRQVALAAGAQDGLVQKIADKLVQEQNIRVERAAQLLAESRETRNSVTG